MFCLSADYIFALSIYFTINMFIEPCLNYSDNSASLLRAVCQLITSITRQIIVSSIIQWCPFCRPSALSLFGTLSFLPCFYYYSFLFLKPIFFIILVFSPLSLLNYLLNDFDSNFNYFIELQDNFFHHSWASHIHHM